MGLIIGGGGSSVVIGGGTEHGGGTGTGTVTEVTSTTDTLTVDTATTTPKLTIEGAPAIAGTTVTGTASDGQVLTGTGDAAASWETAGGGSGTVTEVTSPDTSVRITTATTTPKLETGEALWVSGYWYGSRIVGAGTIDVAFNTAYWLPFTVDRTFTGTALGVVVTVALVSATLRLAVYKTTGHGKPGALVHTAGTVSAATSGAKTVALATLVLAPGVYFLAVAHQGITGSLDLRYQYAVAAEASINGIATLTEVASTSLYGYSAAGITGAFPATAPAVTAVTASTSMPAILIKSA